MKKRVLKSRVNEIMKRPMPTCYFNAVSSRFCMHSSERVVKFFERMSPLAMLLYLPTLIALSILDGQRMLPRKAKEIERRYHSKKT